jgi:uncharacterized protein (DUF1501 family)
MKRRAFLSMAAASCAALSMPRAFGTPLASRGTSPRLDALATARDAHGKLLVLIELEGGNDGLNTVIPYVDPAYYALREHIAVPRDRVLALDERTALHPSLRPLLPLWSSGQLAIVQGVGFAQANPSHFRSKEIWDTASRADVYQRDGWLTRALAQWPVARPNVATVMWGSVEAGPFAGMPSADSSTDVWPRVDDPDDAWHFDAKLDESQGDPVSASNGILDEPRTLRSHALPLSDSIDVALSTSVDGSEPGANVAIRLTLDGFDTHAGQPERHAALLDQLARGCAKLEAELTRRGRWDDTLVMTYSEFGRSARENESRGTEHGGAAAHFVTGGLVRGGVYGRAPDLTRLDATGSLHVEIDFRRLYATALGPFWRIDPQAVLADDVKPLPLLRV